MNKFYIVSVFACFLAEDSLVGMPPVGRMCNLITCRITSVATATE